MTGKQYRCDAHAAKFNWDEWHRDNAHKMNLVRQSLAELAAVEEAIAQTHRDFISDMRSIFGGEQ